MARISFLTPLLPMRGAPPVEQQSALRRQQARRETGEAYLTPVGTAWITYCRSSVSPSAVL